MTELLQNRKTFYDNLLDDGYFKDEDGSINFSFEEFDESLNDNDNIVTLYENLLGDGYFRDEDGEITLTGPDFVAMIGQSTEKQEYYPLTGNQLGIYADWEANRNTTQYNIPTLTRYEGIDVEHLVRALHTVVDAHPYLKMQLAETDEGVMQHRRDEAETVIQVHKMNVEPEKSFFQSQVRPFNLFSDDLYRIAIYQTPKAVYLFKDMHHIIYDGGSMGIFDAQLREAYSGGKIGSETYSAYEFSLEENARQQGEGYAEAEAFFDALLKGQSATPYPSSRTLDESRTQCQALGKKLDLAVSGYCRQHAITPNSFFMAALSLLLHKVSREDDVMYVTISHGRNTMEMMNIMGMFVKTLPVTSHMSPNDQLTTRFSDYARKAHEQYVDVAERDFYPFTTMVERHGVHPEILFAYQDGSYSESSDNGDGSTDVAGNIKSEHISLSLDTTKEPVTIEVEALGNDQYVLGLEYDTTRYNAKDMGRLLNAYAQVAIQVCEEDRTLGNIALVDKHEADVLHALGCGDFLVYDTNDTMVDILRHQAALTPDATAVVFRDRSLTYAQLDGLTDRLARYLTSSGVGRGQAVGVMIGRSELMLVYPMAIQKAGAAYMPLDPHFPEDRLMFMCDDAGVRLILSEGSLPPTVMPSFTGKVFLAEGLASLEEAGNGKWETGSGPKATDAAVILFTSGSTGKPKGCVLEHHGIVNFAHWYAKEMKMDNSSKSAGYANFGFDAHMIDIYPTLFAGGTVYILPEELRMDLVAMNDYIEANGITTAFFTTQIGVQMVSLFENKSLRTVSTGGEKMPPIRKPSYDFYNVYGPTECSMFSTFYKIETEYFDGTDSIIGRPLDNYQLYVVDSCMNLVPCGVPGELLVSGIGVGREYLNRPDITAEKFISFNGMKAYRTGDLVRWTDDGNIEFLGRIDNQVKLRGLRIELGEVETAIARYDGIRQVVVDVKEVNGVQHLCCYYVATEPSQGVDTEALKTFLRESLTEFMVPTQYLELDALPLTPNGKVNRRELPLPVVKNDVEFVEPSTDNERAIARYFANVLNTNNPIGALDNFFSLGGDSIKAIRLVSMLRQEGISLKVAQVMKLKTVRAIAAAAGDDAESHVIDQTEWDGEIANSAIVQYFFDLCLPEPHHFNQDALLRCNGRVDMKILAKAADSIVRHHDVLRAQVRKSALDIRPYTEGACYDLYEYHVDDHEELHEIASTLQATLDIENGNMMRVAVFHAEECDYLLVIIHHLVVDGVSWRIIVEDFNIAYSNLASGLQAGLPAKTHSYKYYTEAMERYRQSHDLRLERDYWTKVRSRVEAMAGSQVDDHSRQFAVAHAVLDRDTTYALLHDSNQAYNTEINDLLLTALGRAYQRLTGKNAVSIQLEGHGRESINELLEIDRTVGWFTSIFPLTLSGLGKDLRSDIRNPKQTLHAIPNKGLGYGQLFGMDCHTAPMIGFNYHGDFSESGGYDSTAFFTIADGMAHGSGVSEKNRFITDISINGSVCGGEFQYSAVYNTAIFTDEDMARFDEYYIDELRNIVGHTSQVRVPETTASDLGETTWTDDEFQKVAESFHRRGVALRRIYPLTPMQESILLKAMADSDTTAYRIFYQLHVGTLLTEKQVRRAADVLMGRHEVLSTTFIHKDVSIYRQALTDRQIPVVMEDATDDTEATLERIRRRETERGFDLQNDVLMRIVCVRTGECSCKLMLFFHHIIIDGWCLHLIFADLAEGLASEQAALSLQDVNAGVYESYVRELGRRNREASLEYWKNLLAGYEQKAVIPSHGIVPEQERSPEGHMSMDVEPETMSGLADVSAKAGVTLNSIVELVWGITLGVYNRTQDTVFVKVVSGRNTSLPGINSVVGLCINSVPVRVRFDYDDTVAEALRKIQSQAAETNDHDYCPLSEIIGQTSLQSELFQSIIAFENYPDNERTPEDAPAINITGDNHHEEVFSEISFSVSTNDSKTRMLFNMSYDTTMYRAKEIRQVLDTMHELLKEIARQGDAKLGSLKLVPDASVGDLVALGTGEELEYDSNDTMVDVFCHQAALTPDAICVVYNGRQYTYRHVDEQSDRLAVHLKSLGVGHETAVGLMINRSELILIYSMAVMKAGGAYMPLDYKFPEERLMFMCEDAGVRVILTYENMADMVLPGFDGIIINNHDMDALPAGELTVGSRPKATDAAVILYTSGSTGKPKGCVLEHHGIVNFAHWYMKATQMTDKDVVAAYANFGFDAHMIDIYPTLLSGGVLHILTEEVRMNFESLNNYINENGVTVAFFTTQIGCQIASLFPDNNLRVMTIGGEKMPPTKKTSYTIFNGYGPTECSLYSTCHKVEGDYDGNISIIGRPLDNYQLYIVDSCMNLVPRGVPGELIVSGIGVGREYLNRPDITAEKFISFNGMKAYRTGDLVRWMDDGNIEFLGRIDNQIKLRGLRIELGEIENQVLAIEGINQAAAVVKKIGDLEHLVLYYTTTTEGISDEGISNALEASTLPHFMIPEVFVKLEVMPYNANGKIDRKALPMPAFKLTEYVAPRSETEKAICDAMQRILQIDRVGIDDDFFKLGGTSLAALKLQFQSGLKWLTVRAINEGKTARKIVQQVIEKERAMLPSHPSSESESKMLSIAQRIIGDNGISVVQDIVTISNNFSFVTDFVNACHEEGIEVSEQDVKTKRNIREMVTGTQSLAYWYRPYDESKPVIVSVCGMVPQEYLGYRMNELSKTFNVLIFWPTFDFAEYGFSEDSLQDIVGLYHELVCCYLPEGVLPFGYIGYCLGGVIALMLASMMSKERKYYPLVYMLDSWPEVTFKESYEYDGVDEHGLDYDDLPEFLKNRLRFVRKISKGTTIPTYDGYSVLFAATICEGHDIAQNKEFWKSKCSRLKIYDLPGTHDDIVCLDIHSDFVVKKVNKDFNKKGMSDKHDKS